MTIKQQSAREQLLADIEITLTAYRTLHATLECAHKDKNSTIRDLTMIQLLIVQEAAKNQLTAWRTVYAT